MEMRQAPLVRPGRFFVGRNRHFGCGVCLGFGSDWAGMCCLLSEAGRGLRRDPAMDRIGQR